MIYMAWPSTMPEMMTYVRIVPIANLLKGNFMTTPRLLLQFPPAVLKALDLDKIPIEKRYPDSPHPRKRPTNNKPIVKLPPIKEEKKKPPFKP